MIGIVKKNITLAAIIFGLSVVALAQAEVRITTLSSKYDVVTKQSNCNHDWRGSMCDEKIELFRKKASRPFQTTSMRGSDEPPIFGDFNFDGHEDMAICDGKNGGYVTNSYSGYLYSPTLAKFVFDPSFTALSQGPAMGFFDIDRRNKTLTTATRMGFGHFTQRKYVVYRGKPRLIYERIFDGSSAEGIWAVITTRKLIRGKWRTWQKREKIPQTTPRI